MKPYSFSLKPTVIILVLIAVLFTVMTGLNYYFTSGMLTDSAQLDSKKDVQLLVNQIERVMKPVEDAVLSIKTHFNYENINTRDLKKYLKTIAEENEHIISVHGIYFSPTSNFTGEKYSVISFSNSAQSGISQESTENFIGDLVKTGLEESGLFWSEPFVHPEMNQLAVACMIPANFILPDSMLTRGFLTATISLKWLEKLIISGEIFTASSVLVLSRDGKPVISSGNEYNPKDDVFAIAKTTQNAEFIELGSKMKSGKSGFMNMKNFGFKGPSFVSFQSIPITGWSVAAGISKSELFSGLYFTTIILIITALFVLILVLWLQRSNFRKVVQPIKAITSAVREIGSGKAGVVLPKIDKPLILSELADALSAMQIDFQHYANSLGRKPKEPERHAVSSAIPLQSNKIRSSLLRHDFESFAANRNFDLTAILNMSDGEYGNFYDYFMVNNHTLCFCVGDVKGKGFPASLFITRALTFFRTGNYFNESLGRVITGINHHLYQQNTDGLAVTFFVGLLNFENSELIFCNANHPFPYLIKGGDLFEVHGMHGPALAEQADQVYKTGKLKLEPGDKLVLFTQGITNANNDQGDIFGKDWFEDVLRDSSNFPLMKMAGLIDKELKSFIGNTPQLNDITLFIIQAGRPQPVE